MADFHIGQQVVCVGRFAPHRWVKNYPQVGSIYRIRGFRDIGDVNLLFIWLEEIVNPLAVFYDGHSEEPSFDLRGFRPVRKTDISVFTEMLNTQPIKEKEKV